MTTDIASWDELPTRGQIKARINEFLHAVHDGKLEVAFKQCPLQVWEDDGGAVLRPTISKKELAAHLEHSMFGALDGQEVVEDELEEADASDPATWCGLITPPSAVDYEDIALSVPGTSEEDGDDKRATGGGEVLANVHLKDEVTDITGRYQLTQHDGKWILAFGSFDVM